MSATGVLPGRNNPKVDNGNVKTNSYFTPPHNLELICIAIFSFLVFGLLSLNQTRIIKPTETKKKLNQSPFISKRNRRNDREDCYLFHFVALFVIIPRV